MQSHYLAFLNLSHSHCMFKSGLHKVVHINILNRLSSFLIINSVGLCTVLYQNNSAHFFFFFFFFFFFIFFYQTDQRLSLLYHNWLGNQAWSEISFHRDFLTFDCIKLEHL